MSCVVADVVAAEKFISSRWCVSGARPSRNCCTSTLFPVPVLPTTSTPWFVIARDDTMNELRSVSTVGTKISLNAAPLGGRHPGVTFSSHSLNSFALWSTKYSYTVCTGGKIASMSRRQSLKRRRPFSSTDAPTDQMRQNTNHFSPTAAHESAHPSRSTPFSAVPSTSNRLQKLRTAAKSDTGTSSFSSRRRKSSSRGTYLSNSAPIQSRSSGAVYLAAIHDCTNGPQPRSSTSR